MKAKGSGRFNKSVIFIRVIISALLLYTDLSFAWNISFDSSLVPAFHQAYIDFDNETVTFNQALEGQVTENGQVLFINQVLFNPAAHQTEASQQGPVLVNLPIASTTVSPPQAGLTHENNHSHLEVK